MSEQLIIIFTDDLFCQPCGTWVFSKYFIYGRIIIQITIVLYSWLWLSELSAPSIQNSLLSVFLQLCTYD